MAKAKTKAKDKKSPTKKTAKKTVKKKAKAKKSASAVDEPKVGKAKAKAKSKSSLGGEAKAEGTADDAMDVSEVSKSEAPIKKEKLVKPIAKIEHLPRKDSKSSDKHKPKFNRQELGRLPRIKDKWRAPRGIDSKKHEKKRGRGALPSIGYKKPERERDIHYGFTAVRIQNISQLMGLDPEKEAAVIARQVGRLKRNQLIEKANELKITILNPRRGEA